MGRVPASIHFNEIDSVWNPTISGVPLMRFAQELLSDALSTVRDCDDSSGARDRHWAVVYLPIGASSDSVLEWTDDLWDQMGLSDEPPSLSVTKVGSLLGRSEECYYRPLSSKYTDGTGTSLLYRSSRSGLYIRNGWREFDNGVYLFCDD